MNREAKRNLRPEERGRGGEEGMEDIVRTVWRSGWDLLWFGEDGEVVG